MRRAAKVDANQGPIVEALRKVGASVQSLAAVGRGCPDLLVAYRGRNFLLEVKQLKGKMTPDQKRWFVSWRGDVALVRSAHDALVVIGAINEVQGMSDQAACDGCQDGVTETGAKCPHCGGSGRIDLRHHPEAPRVINEPRGVGGQRLPSRIGGAPGARGKGPEKGPGRGKGRP
jgi:hypothetical protein